MLNCLPKIDIGSRYRYTAYVISKSLEDILYKHKKVDIPKNVLFDAINFFRDGVGAIEGRIRIFGASKSIAIYRLISDVMTEEFREYNLEELDSKIRGFKKLTTNLKNIDEVCNTEKQEYIELKRFFSRLSQKSDEVAYVEVIYGEGSGYSYIF